MAAALAAGARRLAGLSRWFRDERRRRRDGGGARRALPRRGGEPIGDGGGSLLALARIDVRPGPRGRPYGRGDRRSPTSTIRCADRSGASVVFGPQKGASPDDVIVLDRALAHLAAVAARDLGVDRSREPGAGAAGGLGFGLLAFAGARLRPGVEVVMEAVGFAGAARGRVDWWSRGRASFDAGSLHGKVPAGVLRGERARRACPWRCSAASRAPTPPGPSCGPSWTSSAGSSARRCARVARTSRPGARRGGTRALRSSRMTPAQPIRSERRTRPRGEGSQPSPVTI